MRQTWTNALWTRATLLVLVMMTRTRLPLPPAAKDQAFQGYALPVWQQQQPTLQPFAVVVVCEGGVDRHPNPSRRHQNQRETSGIELLSPPATHDCEMGIVVAASSVE